MDVVIVARVWLVETEYASYQRAVHHLVTLEYVLSNVIATVPATDPPYAVQLDVAVHARLQILGITDVLCNHLKYSAIYLIMLTIKYTVTGYYVFILCCQIQQ